MRPVLLFLLGSISVFAQPFSAGIKAGIPLTDFLSATENGTFDLTSTTQRYIIGGVAEVRLPLGLGVEFDALYRRVSYTGSGNLLNVFTTASTSGLNLLFHCARPSAASVPSTMDSPVEATPMIMLFFSDSIQRGELMKSSYQRRERPGSG